MPARNSRRRSRAGAIGSGAPPTRCASTSATRRRRERRCHRGSTCIRFTAGDEEGLRTALNEAFGGDPFFHEVSPAQFREFYLRTQGFDPSLWLLAWDAGELAGFVLAFPKRSGDTALGWVQSLGVRPRWRHRGIGEALLRAAIGRLHARGLRAVGLGVQADNQTGALRLYERVGMQAVSRIDNWVLDLG
jgi:ribosomal protein S18 acetylase RimI-like enzyme